MEELKFIKEYNETKERINSHYRLKEFLINYKDRLSEAKNFKKLIKELNTLKPEDFKIEKIRKDKGFEVLDNINLYISGNAMLEEVIKQNAELIKHDTLAINIIYNQDRKEYTETNINGETLNIDVEVVNK